MPEWRHATGNRTKCFSLGARKESLPPGQDSRPGAKGIESDPKGGTPAELRPAEFSNLVSANLKETSDTEATEPHKFQCKVNGNYFGIGSLCNTTSFRNFIRN